MVWFEVPGSATHKALLVANGTSSYCEPRSDVLKTISSHRISRSPTSGAEPAEQEGAQYELRRREEELLLQTQGQAGSGLTQQTVCARPHD